MTELTPTLRRAEPAHLLELASLSGGEPQVLSLFLNLDPTDFATPEARQSAIRSLINEASSEVEKLEGDEKKPLRESLALVEAYLDNEDEWTKGADGLAIYCSTEAELFDVLQLPFSPEQKAVVQRGAFLEPVQAELTGTRYCVILVSRRTFRIFLGPPHHLKEIADESSDVRGQHQAGGWSQRRFELSVEEDVKNHLEQPAERLLSLLKRNRFENLVVSAADELWPQFENELNAEVSERIVGRISVDTDLASVDDIEKELEGLVERLIDEKEKRLLADLEQNLGRGEKAAAGLDAVLKALVELKVDTLLFDSRLDARGVACRTCHWLGKAGDICPVDSGELDRDVDLVERASQLCLSTSGSVHIMRDPEPLQRHGGIAAILRF